MPVPDLQGIPCGKGAVQVSPCAMSMVFDMDDRARLPWRFYGATCTVLARL